MTTSRLIKCLSLSVVVLCSSPGELLARSTGECSPYTKVKGLFTPPDYFNVIRGTRYGDTIVGSDSHDAIYALDGKDYIYGGDGVDLLFGGPGDDYMDGAAGADCFDGGTGDDELRGGRGRDRYFFRIGDGDDTVWDSSDGAGTLSFDTQIAHLRLTLDELDHLVIDYYVGDRVTVKGSDRAAGIGSIRFGGSTYALRVGGRDTDLLAGGDGRDWLHGDDGDDGLFGNGGADRLYGAAGDDYILGNGGDDYLDGGYDDDELWGGSGDDLLVGATGADELHGEIGDDVYRFQGGFGHDTVDEFGYAEDVDVLDFPFLSPEDLVIRVGDPLALVVDYGVGDSVTVPYQFATAGGPYGYGIERIRVAGTSYDFFVGTDGADWIVGGAGHDLLVGDATSPSSWADDEIAGYGGDDVLWGGVGNDTLRGGDGDDLLIGGAHRDDLDGQAGSDTYLYRGDGTDLAPPGEDIVESGPPGDVDTVDIRTIALNALELVRDGDDLVVDYSTSMWMNRIRVHDQYAGRGIERIEAGGFAVAVQPLAAMLTASGDRLELTTSADRILVRTISNGVWGLWTEIPALDPGA